MHELSRRDFLAAVAAAPMLAATARAQTPTLKDACRGLFLIGAAFDFRTPTEFTDAERSFIRSQFNAVTPENSMKPGPVHPQEDTWNWTAPDTLVQFGRDNDIRIFGHTLVWHSQTNPWFFEGATREVLLNRLRTHIHTLVGRYKGRLSGWDVVNEAINDGQGTGENLRQSQWLKIVGPDFLLQAFKFAREADPDVPLLYNDYNIESGAKHQSSLLLLRRLIDEGAPITGVGIQGHWSLPALTTQKYEEIERAIENYRALKLRVSITELDVTVAGTGGGQLGRGRGAAPEPPSPDVLEAQAEAYGKLFALFVKHRDAIDRITFWGLSDRRSWRRTGYPLPWDAEYQPKPAFRAIVDAVSRARA